MQPLRLRPRRANSPQAVHAICAQLNTRIEDTEASLALNKELLKEILEKKFTQKAPTSVRVFQRLVEENVELSKELAVVNGEVSDLATKALLVSQVKVEAELRREHTIKEFKDKVWELEYQIERKQGVLNSSKVQQKKLQLECETIGLSRFIVSCAAQPALIPGHCAIEKYRESMKASARELLRALRSKNSLKYACQEVHRQNQIIEALLKNPTTRKGSHKREFSGPANPLEEINVALIEKKVSIECDLDEFEQEDIQDTHFKTKLQEIKQDADRLTEELFVVLHQNQQVRQRNEKLAERYRQVIYEIDESQGSEAFDMLFPRSSLVSGIRAFGEPIPESLSEDF